MAGIIVASIVGALAIFLLLFFCLRLKKKRAKADKVQQKLQNPAVQWQSDSLDVPAYPTEYAEEKISNINDRRASSGGMDGSTLSISVGRASDGSSPPASSPASTPPTAVSPFSESISTSQARRKSSGDTSMDMSKINRRDLHNKRFNIAETTAKRTSTEYKRVNSAKLTEDGRNFKRMAASGKFVTVKKSPTNSDRGNGRAAAANKARKPLPKNDSTGSQKQSRSGREKGGRSFHRNKSVVDSK